MAGPESPYMRDSVGRDHISLMGIKPLTSSLHHSVIMEKMLSLVPPSQLFSHYSNFVLSGDTLYLSMLYREVI